VSENNEAVAKGAIAYELIVDFLANRVAHGHNVPDATIQMVERAARAASANQPDLAAQIAVTGEAAVGRIRAASPR
jgi:hypothetical protein